MYTINILSYIPPQFNRRNWQWSFNHFDIRFLRLLHCMLPIFIIYTIIIWTYVHVCADMSCQITVALRVYIVQSQSATETRRNSILTVSSIKFHYGFAVRKVHSIRIAPSLNFSLVAQQLVKLVKPKDRTGIAQRMTTSSTFTIKIDGMRSNYWTNHKSRLFNCR